MPTSVFFNNFGASNEQTLVEDLVIESIKIYGIDLWYVPRTQHNTDPLYQADDVSTFESAIQIEMYVRTYDQFQGDGNLMSKFGLEIRDQVVFAVSQRVFGDEVNKVLNFKRPREGDLIYYPLDKKLFEIKYVEKKVFHYPMGMLPTWDLHCELFEYSHEDFNTGIDEIDDIEEELSGNANQWALLTEDNKLLYTEDSNPIIRETYDPDGINPSQDNTNISTDREDLIDFSELNPFSEEFIK